MGKEVERLDQILAKQISEEDRSNIWKSASRIIDSHSNGTQQCTLALGYVQSGKTTSMAATAAVASDAGYRIVIAFLGSTLLLLDQNRKRIENLLGVTSTNYQWVSLHNVGGATAAKEFNEWLDKGRTLFVPLLKHAGHIEKLNKAIENLNIQVPVLILDDEADQASLNTRPASGSGSSTYTAITRLRSLLPDHLLVQYTATPYAPLLLERDDPLMPTKVEFLRPGTGYTGGREFLITNAKSAVRIIPFGDENSKSKIAHLPKSLTTAFAAYLAGASILSQTDSDFAPVSMLIHPTHVTDAQKLYMHLLKKFISSVKGSDVKTSEFGKIIETEYWRIVENGGQEIGITNLFKGVDTVLSELVLWLVNSTNDVKTISWNYSPFHVLVGGNKLDRGFTVEGLTISYINRKASEQIDTTEQRARAFGYRSQYLPYCQIHAGARTIRLLRGIVHTEDDLRASLRDALDEGKQVGDWAESIGLDLPAGTIPSRKNVLPALKNFNSNGNWHVLRNPLTDVESISRNAELISGLGLLTSPARKWGRIEHRLLMKPIRQVIDDLLQAWQVNDESPSWRHDQILDFLRRHPRQNEDMPIILLAKESVEETVPRDRKWVRDSGFVNLFQGRDLETRVSDRYEGDSQVGFDLVRNDGIILQVHYVVRRNDYELIPEPNLPLFTLAINLGDRQITTRDKENIND
jgi:hypothetical protein